MFAQEYLTYNFHISIYIAPVRNNKNSFRFLRSKDLINAKRLRVNFTSLVTRVKPN